ncbi:porin [Arcobacter arenosus]|uniref:porin n=1 Tax=Arcobacter arenosus TaxID=2576037 RepID=UPI003BAD3791
MKKFAKMSLAAAIAVGGLTSTASAVDLEQAIKGVDISGQVRYRMEDNTGVFGGADQEDQDVNIDVTVKVPVNDNVNFIANANFDNDDQGDAGVAGAGAAVLDEYYFQYINGPVTAHLGAQVIPGRQTDGLIGEGLVGLYNAGAFTIGAAGFYNSEATSQTIYSVIAMGSIGPVSLLGQYTDAEDALDSYNLKADATFGPVTAGVEYSETDEDANNLDLSTFKAYVSGSIDIVSATLAYVGTGDDGSGSIDHAVETPAEFLLWQMGSGNVITGLTKGVADLDAWALDASVKVTDSISIRAAYGDGEAGNTDLTETLGQVSYKMSKNLNTYIRYSQFEVGNQENDRGRVEVKYTF